jgi:hypothetical protein
MQMMHEMQCLIIFIFQGTYYIICKYISLTTIAIILYEQKISFHLYQLEELHRV